MKSWISMAVVLALTPASPPVWAQGAPRAAKPKAGVVHTDPCAPIGRTADGQLVYAMACDKLPAPAGGAAPVAAAPAAEPERGGLFRNPLPSLFGSTGTVERESGVGPSTGGR